MTLLELFEAELQARGLRWCRGECGERGHKRGFVMKGDKLTVHLDAAIATRSSLHRGLHEIGHCVNDERGLRRFEKEAQANAFAETRLRELGVPVPRSTARKGRAYVARFKRFGDAVAEGLAAGRGK